VDALSDRLMFRTQYRNFGSYETLVSNHTADVDGTDHAGVHWFELRDTGSGWSLYQQGVYAPDSNHRWMGSIAMDLDGNIALGYSVSSSSVFPSIRYTGRLAGDPLGTMAQGEATLIVGSDIQTDPSGRWGDYSMMSVDPVNDCTFWYTQEYIQTTGIAPWQTRIGSFAFDSCTGLTERTYLPLIAREFAPLRNGKFESGPTVWTEFSLQGWPIILDSPNLPVPPHGGNWAAWLGGDDDEIAYIQQQVTVQVGAPYLAYWQWVDSIDLCGFDRAYIRVNGTNVDQYRLCFYDNSGGWLKRVVNLSSYQGQTVTLEIRLETDFENYTSMFVDDVAFQSTPSIFGGPLEGQPNRNTFGPKAAELEDWWVGLEEGE
jgi:hypothetical protein